MKKNLCVLFSLLVLFLPFKVNALQYETNNLEEVLTKEEIEHNLEGYNESDDKINIYLFRGHGCAYCNAFLTFLNSIVPEYGKYFNLVSYEVWENENNSKLMQEVSTFLNQSASGVPYIIIGDQVFSGYASSYDDRIKSAIKNLYETKKSKRYDVFKEMKKADRPQVSNWLVLLWITLATFIIIYYQHRHYKILIEKIDSLRKEEPKEEKSKKNKKGQK